MSPKQLHSASIATSRHHIMIRRLQGASLVDYYDTLMETCNARKTKFWIQSQGGALNARAVRVQCGRSATIWASSCTGDPYFLTLGASLLPLP